MESLCQDPIPPELQDKFKITLSCLGGHLQIHGDIEPSPIVLAEQATMDKTMQHLQKIASTLADLNAEGLNAQTVNDLLTMYVGAASQHVLRTSFVPEQEAQNFDMQFTAFWSHLIQRDVTSPLLFLPLKNLEDLGCGLCSPATRSSSMARLAIDHSQNHGNNAIGQRQPVSTRHHDSEPNLHNFKPHLHYR